jgi:hypothetical protein
MKKNLLIALLTVFSTTGLFAQTFGIYEGTGNTDDVSGTVYDLASNTQTFEQYFAVRLLSGNPTSIKIRRKVIVAPSSDIINEVCYAQIPDINVEGTCVEIATSNLNWTSPNAINLDLTNYGEVKIKLVPNASMGSVHYRYYLESTDGNFTHFDSLDVRYDAATANVKEVKNVLQVNAFPNPADNQLTVQVKGVSTETTVRITDVLGNLIEEEKFVGQRKIDVSELRNGVYIVSIFSNGTLLQTRRIVIKH